MKHLGLLLRRELALAWGGGGGPLTAVAFSLGLTALFPLALGADPRRLAAAATGAAWLALALASLLSLERMVERDFEDGALDLLALGPAPLEAVALAKTAAQWLAVGLPLAGLSPLAAIALGADPARAPAILGLAALGALGFACTGGVGAALSLGSRRGGLLTTVIVLPLFAPPVIFGAGALARLEAGADPTGGVLLLAAYVLAAAALSPFAMAAAIRNALG